MTKVRGGMVTDDDGIIHPLFTHNPETLRLACQHPNIQQLPRGGKDDELGSIVRNLIVARPGQIFLARDYSGIEAVLVGWMALSSRYIRLAKIDVHSFYMSYALNQIDGRIKSADLPLLSWSDEKLIPHLAAIKKEFKEDRNNLYKHIVHGTNFMMGAKGVQEKILKESGIEPKLQTIKTVQGIYFELFPEVSRWHRDTMNQAEKDGYLRNPFGYILRFNKIYRYEKVGGKWNKTPGDEANSCIAFGPQSTAAAIIKESMLRLYFDHFDRAGQYMRFQIHDENFLEVPEESVEQVDVILKEEMERPIPELPMMKAWNLGKYLSIETERKMGKRMGSMS